MKALHVTTHFNIGGIANYILTLSKALKARGISVIVASSGGDLEPELEKAGIPHRLLGIRTKSELHPKVFISALALSRIIREEGVQIVHAHSRVSQAASLIACHLAGVPFVTTCHGYFKKRMRGIFDTWGARVIAISDAVKAHLEDDLGVSGERIRVIYSGVDSRRFLKDYSVDEINDIKRSLGLRNGPVVGTIGRLSPVKGQGFLIKAMAGVISGRADAQALIVGNGDEEAALKEMSSSLGITDSVRFINADPDTARFLAVMDVFVFPSVKEGLGIALLEALAAGSACVASDVGGIGDIIKSGTNGLLVPVGDPAAITKAVLRLLEDTAVRREMGEKGRRLVRERFSLDSMADKVVGLYKEVLK